MNNMVLGRMRRILPNIFVSLLLAGPERPAQDPRLTDQRGSAGNPRHGDQLLLLLRCEGELCSLSCICTFPPCLFYLPFIFNSCILSMYLCSDILSLSQLIYNKDGEIWNFIENINLVDLKIYGS